MSDSLDREDIFTDAARKMARDSIEELWPKFEKLLKEQFEQSIYNKLDSCTNKIVAALLAQHSIEVNQAAMDCYRRVLKELERGK